MANETKGLSKQALDSVAERYWEDYYKDSGYGKQWVRKIPMRVKAELAKSAQAKTAAAASALEPTLRPLSTIQTNDRVHLEGLAISGQGDSRKVKAFVVDFDHEGNVHGFESVDVQ